ncbi:hypothetical protein K466DRAFT_352060 [Polyporus arcularius HHB13444]|uniref:Uncharacterized protein n=1 Tax=Polyporus arcularius HHB13444 TaxID=1314778 RepID=A0A5C3NUD1_9APHY|nr:hypothetical protein K466DRAFT_352060 [Polyporus arcularius HHB13444]
MSSEVAPSAPVDTLPPEVLTVIFSDLQDVLEWTGPPSMHKLGHVVHLQSRTWLRISWVCRYWRAVSLASPRLWSTLSDSGHWKSMDWLPAFLERSRQFPLDVSIWRSNPANMAIILTELIQHAGRIHALYLWTKSIPLSSLLAPFEDGFPILEEIVLRDYMDPQSREAQPLLHLSPSRYPTLRRVFLSQVAVSWHHKDLFQSLHELVITRCRRVEALPPATLLRILRQSPEIEILKFDGHIWSEEYVGLPHSRELSLPHMRQMELRGSPLPLSRFLDQLVLPYSTNVLIDYEMGYHVGDIPSGISMILPRQSAFQALLPNWSSLSVDIGGRSVSFAAKSNYHSRGTLKLTAFVPPRHTVNLTTMLWDDILDAFSGSPLMDVGINYHSLANITSDMWATLFARVPHLGTLATSAEGEVDYHGEPYGSRLRTLHLCHFTIDKPFAYAILRLLRFRNANHAPLQCLVFRDPFCRHEVDSVDFLAQLKELVRVDVRYSTRGSGAFRYLDDTTSFTEQEVLHEQ